LIFRRLPAVIVSCLLVTLVISPICVYGTESCAGITNSKSVTDQDAVASASVGEIIDEAVNQAINEAINEALEAKAADDMVKEASSKDVDGEKNDVETASEAAGGGTLSEVLADATSSDALAQEATNSEVPAREYTEDDWDKWRVAYRRIDKRPYEETKSEQKIYSYTQLPPHDTGKTRWSGAWYGLEEGGKLFANFGCGICCISNIYSTFVQRPVDPGQMLEIAKYYTSYNPAGKYGAIDWPQMKLLCQKLGMKAETKKKPQDYAEFQNDVMKADATVVLVCKDNDPGLWFYTNGHYVTLWEYDPEDDTLFVTDSSGLFNRERVFLKDVYDALKTRSSCQYMCVDADILGYGHRQ